MDRNNVKNIEFISPKLIDTLIILSDQYAVSFDDLVNIAVLKFIGDVNLLRLIRDEKVDIIALSEKILF